MAFVLACGCAAMFGQTVTSSLVGSVVDPSDAVVAGAPVTLTDTGTGAVRHATTDNLGTYRFVNLDPGTYNVAVAAAGFKNETQTGIVVSAQETHNAGKMVLQIGNATDSVTVSAEAAQVQLNSSEKSQTVDSKDLEDLTLKGRDLFGYIKLVPGVIDTASSRDVTSHGAISGMNINGATSALNFTVDGVTDMDTGSNTSVQFEPNLDAIQELKVLTSNYAAEFGRNSGGTITMVTKNEPRTSTARPRGTTGMSSSTPIPGSTTTPLRTALLLRECRTGTTSRLTASAVPCIFRSIGTRTRKGCSSSSPRNGSANS
jgi:Carboxypeptidase regulatory-like domain/TonB-dependent Receptor Plug Domain